MLICNPCLTKYYHNKPSIRRLIGKCESCGKFPMERSDIPSAKLDSIIPVECNPVEEKPGRNRFYG